MVDMELTPIFYHEGEAAAMDKKEALIDFLNSARDLEAELLRQMERVEQLERRCRRLSAPPTDAVRGGGKGRGEILAALVDARSEMIAAGMRASAQWQEVDSFIDRLDDPRHRIILARRYLSTNSWKKIQNELSKLGLCYSEKTLYRLHSAALAAAEMLWEDSQSR